MIDIASRALQIPYHLRAGTVFLGESPSTKDASIVKKIRDAGAVIIGVTNMHELGIGTTGSNPNKFALKLSFAFL
eukprot:m.234627 g.234627  ORF g.234627 m.234627 type:complete len:75 (+) comp40113_c0_seq16:713-937(+)